MKKHALARKISIGIVLFSICMAGLNMRPGQAHAQVLGTGVTPVVILGDTSPTGLLNSVNIELNQVKTYALDGLAWSIAKLIAQQLTASVVQWIDTGFKGSPAFLTNPAGFFTNIGDQATGDFIAKTGILSNLCSPFNIDLRLSLALGQANGQANGGLSRQRYTCTLSTIINNAKNATVDGKSIAGFTGGDFSQGGWPAFIALSDPQNNESGAYLQAQSDLSQNISAKQNTASQQLLQGNGFMSWQSCNDIAGTAGPTTPAGGTSQTGSGGTGSVTVDSSTLPTPVNPFLAEIDQFQTTYQDMGCVNANGNPGPNAGSSSCLAENNIIQKAQANSASWDSYNSNNDPSVSGCAEYNADGSCAQTFDTSGSSGDNSDSNAPYDDGSSNVSTDPQTGSLQTCDTQTPGSVISGELNKSLGSPQDQLNLADSLNEIVGTLMTQLVTQVLQSGLGAVGTQSSGQSQSYISQLYSETLSTSTAAASTGQLSATLDQYVSGAKDIQSLRQQAVDAFETVKGTYATAQACFIGLADAGSSYPVNPYTALVNTRQTIFQDMGCVDANGDPGMNAGDAACTQQQASLEQAQASKDSWTAQNNVSVAANAAAIQKGISDVSSGLDRLSTVESPYFTKLQTANSTVSSLQAQVSAISSGTGPQALQNSATQLQDFVATHGPPTDNQALQGAQSDLQTAQGSAASLSRDAQSYVSQCQSLGGSI